MVHRAAAAVRVGKVIIVIAIAIAIDLGSTLMTRGRRQQSWFFLVFWFAFASLLVACNLIIGAELTELRSDDVDANVAGDTQPVTPTADTSISSSSGDTGTQTPDTAPPTTFVSISGTVTGLLGSGLVLKSNGTDDLPITKDGSFTFAAKVASGSPYAVTIGSLPSKPTQACAIANGSGTATNVDVSNVAISCKTAEYTVGGRIVGLTGVGLILTNNSGDDLAVSAGTTTFNFATPIASGGAYTIGIKTQPSTGGPCSVSGNTGTIGGADTTSSVVKCAAPVGMFIVGGSITGLVDGSATLSNNGSDSIVVTSNGTFAFPKPISSGAAYAVTVSAQPTFAPSSQTCTVSGGSGTMPGLDIASVSVACVTKSFSVGGTLIGVNGTLVLTNNGGDDLSLTTNAPFNFATKVSSGGTYRVAVGTAPAGQQCVLTNNVGTVANASPTNLTVACQDASSAQIRFVSTPLDPSSLSSFQYMFTITGGASANGKAQCKLDRPGGILGTFDNCETQGSHNVSGLTDGVNTFTVQAPNASGAPSTAVHTWLVDKTPPTINITSGPVSPSPASIIAFAYTIVGAIGNAQCKLDTPQGPGTFASCGNASHVVRAVSSGNYTFTVRAFDGASFTDKVHVWVKG